MQEMTQFQAIFQSCSHINNLPVVTNNSGSHWIYVLSLLSQLQQQKKKRFLTEMELILSDFFCLPMQICVLNFILKSNKRPSDTLSFTIVSWLLKLAETSRKWKIDDTCT